MSNFLKSFHKHVSSNDSNDVLYDNKISNVKSKLPKSVDFSDQRSPALTRIYFPFSILDINPPFKYIIFKKKRNKELEYQTIRIPNSCCTPITYLMEIAGLSV